MKQLRITSIAESDLSEIWLFIAEDSVDVADRCFDQLYSKFLLLVQQPFLGRERQDLRPDVRSFICGKIIIFYRTTENFLEIVRVLHGARDIENIF